MVALTVSPQRGRVRRRGRASGSYNAPFCWRWRGHRLDVWRPAVDGHKDAYNNPALWLRRAFKIYPTFAVVAFNLCHRADLEGGYGMYLPMRVADGMNVADMLRVQHQISGHSHVGLHLG